MKLARDSILLLCGIAVAFSAVGQTLQPEAIRPTGVPESLPRNEETATPKPKVKHSRSKTARAPRAESTPRPSAVPQTSGGVPSTGAKSVMMVDARTGQTLYEKNADEVRQAASTQ